MIAKVLNHNEIYVLLIASGHTSVSYMVEMQRGIVFVAQIAVDKKS